MNLKVIIVFFCFSMIFLILSCQSYNFDSTITGTLTTSDNRDSYGYYWRDFYFTPVAGMTYTVNVTAGSTNLGCHISENDVTKTSRSGSGTLIYKPSVTSGLYIAHVSVYATAGNVPVSYSLTISKKY